MIYLFAILLLLIVLLLIVLIFVVLMHNSGGNNKINPDAYINRDYYFSGFDNQNGVVTDLSSLNNSKTFFAYSGAEGTLAVNANRRLKAQIELEDCASGRIYYGRFGEEVIIGRQVVERSDLNDIPVSPANYISRRHCRLFETNGYVFIENISKTGDTIVNNKKINSVEQLQPGDIIVVMDVCLRVANISIL